VLRRGRHRQIALRAVRSGVRRARIAGADLVSRSIAAAEQRVLGEFWTRFEEPSSNPLVVTRQTWTLIS
ncbi:MAG: hypothetical protein M3R66_10260, partial [Actinomycetota bacterium]|nr:hypothetical protein [Actinomycetota bacterium]